MPADMSHASSPRQSVNDGTTGHEARRSCTCGRQLSRKDGCAGWTSIHRRRGLRCLRYEFQSGTQSPLLVARWPGFARTSRGARPRRFGKAPLAIIVVEGGFAPASRFISKGVRPASASTRSTPHPGAISIAANLAGVSRVKMPGSGHWLRGQMRLSAVCVSKDVRVQFRSCVLFRASVAIGYRHHLPHDATPRSPSCLTLLYFGGSPAQRHMNMSAPPCAYLAACLTTTTTCGRVLSGCGGRHHPFPPIHPPGG